MNLIPAVDADIDDIAALVNAAYRGAGAKAGWTHEADYIDGQRTDAGTLRQDLRRQPQAALLTLRDSPEEPLLACVWLEPAGVGVWYLGMLTIRPDIQDRKLGRQVLEAAEVYAAARGARRIRMTVVSVRDTLIAWYERRGYALTGETQPFPYDDQRFGSPRRDDLNFVVLEKALGSPC
ncbi:MAG TPA: GNAT family N-acetyltransferase [Caulobacteraceae bacterium]